MHEPIDMRDFPMTIEASSDGIDLIFIYTRPTIVALNRNDLKQVYMFIDKAYINLSTYLFGLFIEAIWDDLSYMPSRVTDLMEFAIKTNNIVLAKAIKKQIIKSGYEYKASLLRLALVFNNQSMIALICSLEKPCFATCDNSNVMVE